MRFLGVLAIAVVVFASGPAYGGPKETAARAEYEEGTTAYNLGHFDEAALHYEAAYKLVHDPNMLFNIAQSYRLAGKLEQALVVFRGFLRESPADAPNRPLAERFVEDLRRKIEENKAAAKAPTEARPISEPTPAPVAVPIVPAPAIAPVPPAVVAAPAPLPAPVYAPTPLPQAQPIPSSVPISQPWPAPEPTAARPADLMVQPTPVPAGASSEGRPFYKAWWFWTAAGAAVVAGTVTAFLLTRSAPDACDGVGMTCVGVK